MPADEIELSTKSRLVLAAVGRGHVRRYHTTEWHMGATDCCRLRFSENVGRYVKRLASQRLVKLGPLSDDGTERQVLLTDAGRSALAYDEIGWN
jgi:hypothetical protein